MAKGLLGLLHGRASSGRTTRPHAALPPALRRRLREPLDASKILEAAAQEIQRALLSSRASIWLTAPTGGLTLGASVYFPWVVHELYRDSLDDWNRLPEPVSEEAVVVG